MDPAARALVQYLLALDAPGAPPPAAPATWETVLGFGTRSLAPLLLRGLAARSLTGVPPAVEQTLRERARRQAAEYLRQRAALRQTLHLLARRDLPVIVLKGAALAHDVYPDPVLRPMGDLDLWIPPEHQEAAAAVFREAGCADARWARHALPAGAHAAHFEYAWRWPATEVRIEVHTRVRSLEGLSWHRFEPCWAAGRRVPLGDVEMRVLGDEHQLVHTALHLARKNGFSGSLPRLVDLALLTSRPSAAWDWPRLWRDWEREGIDRWMALALGLAREVLRVPALAGLDRPVPRAWMDDAADLLWESPERRLPPAAAGLAGARGVSGWLAFARRRLVDYYWRGVPGRSASQVVREALVRMRWDLTRKVPDYLARWWRGTLRGENLAREVAVERRREALRRWAGPAPDAGGAAPQMRDAPPPPLPVPAHGDKLDGH